MASVRSSVCLSVCCFLTLIEHAAHTQRDSPGGSMRRGQDTFRPVRKEHWPVWHIVIIHKWRWHVCCVDETVKSLYQSKPGAEGWKFRAVIPSITTSLHAQCAVTLCCRDCRLCIVLTLHKLFTLFSATFWLHFRSTF